MTVYFHPAYPWKVFDRAGRMRSKHWRIVRAIEALRRVGHGATLRYCDTFSVWRMVAGAPVPSVSEIAATTREVIERNAERRRRFERGK